MPPAVPPDTSPCTPAQARPRSPTAPRLVLALLVTALALPILAGLAETGRAAFGVLPALGAERPSLDPFRQLAALPGLGTSLRLTLWTGFAATALSLAVAAGLAAGWHRWFGPGAGPRLLAPLLAAPHAALAIGLAFLLAPSGWIARLVSPGLTGWTLPPDLATVNDSAGLALILGLMVKEVPFLLLVLLAAMGQVPVARQMTAGRALGHGAGAVWALVLWPQLYRLIRLPVYVVLSFSLSVVDMALILGPSHPPTLAVAVTRWYAAPDAGLILPASAAALTQAALVAAAVGLWRLAELVAARLLRARLRRGPRPALGRPGLWLAAGSGAALALLGGLALVALVLWSFAFRWPFPDALPRDWTLRGWSLRPGGGPAEAMRATLVAGLASTALALALALAWLEAETRSRRPRPGWVQALIYLPLIVPQVAFLYGTGVVALRAGLTGGMAAVVAGHALFVFPYVMIVLTGPWHAVDPRLLRSAASLGAGPWRRLLAVRLPLLLRPLATAAAIGFAVSVAQYLPTLFLGGGRVATLTTEAVALASGGDRRIAGVHAVLQAALPLLAYGAALLLPALAQRHRRALAGAAPR